MALSLSRRLISVFNVKKILNIEAGLEMIALGMTICSEVAVFYTHLKCSDKFSLYKNNGVFPEMAADVPNVLRRLKFSSFFKSDY